MTLKSIAVKDFQSIKTADVELGKFTVFTGPSSSGKSAFMRAANAVVRNDFTPSQVRQGAKETEVSLQFDDCKVTAIRGKSKSTYKLDDKEYTKAGRTVPEDVEEALRLPLISELESTFSTQFDKPYLVAETGSTAARVLGSLTNVSIIHDSLRESNRRGLESKSFIKVKKADLDKLQEELLGYEGLPEIVASTEELEEDLRLVAETETKASELGLLASNIASTEESIDTCSEKIIDLSEEAQTLDSLQSSLKTMQGIRDLADTIVLCEEGIPQWNYDDVSTISLEEVNVLLKKMQSLCSVQESIEKISEEFPKNDFSAVDELVADFNAISDATTQLLKMHEAVTTLEDTAKLYSEAEKVFNDTHARYNEVQETYDTMMKEFETCPLCGSELH